MKRSITIRFFLTNEADLGEQTIDLKRDITLTMLDPTIPAQDILRPIEDWLRESDPTKLHVTWS